MESAVSVLLLMNSLQRPRNDAGVSVFSTRAFCKLVAAARKERFGAGPGSGRHSEAALAYEFLLPQ